MISMDEAEVLVDAVVYHISMDEAEVLVDAVVYHQCPMHTVERESHGACGVDAARGCQPQHRASSRRRGCDVGSYKGNRGGG
jgi:hypothetical protein